ncbi:MAG: deacylase [Gammaproteobacteria bacterium 39-13]|nr:YbaK/EbsC family protein [Gammaproteobacteria bacterium]OJV87370.1 MAG: deacylase [Gammaproteobacteria bacterium 39-13]
MPVQKLKDYLTQNKVKFTAIDHPVAYATREISHVSHISEKELAKIVIVYAGKKMVMVVVPSNEAIDFQSLRKSLHVNDVSLAPEKDFSKLFPDCELGAMPPFGNLYNIEVYVDTSLTNNKEIAFNSGTHTEIVKLAYEDFEKLVKPTVITATAATTTKH